MIKKFACRNGGVRHYGAQKGFTLAELLTAVLVISVIMVALAPVITKRMKDTVSVQTDNKKGLEIYANPGTYTFDVPIGINTLFIQGSGGGGGGGGATLSSEISIAKTVNSTWTVPKGVNQITLRITGSGGGGGGANGVATGLSPIPEYQIVRGADDGGDLCMFTKSIDGRYPNSTSIQDLIAGDGKTCNGANCCWRSPSNPVTKGNASCTYDAANSLCGYYPNPKSLAVQGSTNPELGTYRLPSKTEFTYIGKNLSNLYSKLNICGTNETFYCPGNTDLYPSTHVCGVFFSNSVGMQAVAAHFTWAQNKLFYRASTFTCRNQVSSLNNPEAYAMQAKCVRPLKHVSAFSGAGGASGAVLEKDISVLPDDTFEITIGTGGNGGASKTNGSQGATTKVVHKRGGVELGTYYVKGGLGGKAATTTSHGSAYTNGTSTNDTTPSDTCYSKSRKSASDSFAGGNTACSIISYSGTQGSETKGGDGGKVNNTGTINSGEASSGGIVYDDPARAFGVRNTTLEADYAKGQNASEYGFGGGGGLTPTWASSASHFFQGGKGANGKVEILYKLALPGSGGGSGARVGGQESGTNKNYEIKYKVKEGDRIVLEVGSGGSGGAIGQDGINGTPSIVGNNEIIFLAGQGGKAVTQTQKDGVRSCVQNASNNSAIANCLSNSSFKPQGGKSGIISTDNKIKTTTLGLIISNTSNTTFDFNATTFKGEDGNTSSQVNANIIPWSYGFDGGVGGAPFGIRASNAAAAVSCGGGMSANYADSTDTANYVCTSGNINGNSGRVHDVANNEFGGSGGGGAGVVSDSFEQGSGGSGSSGYLRIRWDMSEQE